MNDTKPRFYVEYLRFEVVFLDKLMQRRKVLNGIDGKAKKDSLDFVDEEEAREDIEGEVKAGEEGNLVRIVVQNLLERFPENILVLKEVAKILASSAYVDKAIAAQVKDAYSELKDRSPEALLTLVRQQLPNGLSVDKYKRHALRLSAFARDGHELTVLTSTLR